MNAMNSIRFVPRKTKTKNETPRRHRGSVRTGLICRKVPPGLPIEWGDLAFLYRATMSAELARPFYSVSADGVDGLAMSAELAFFIGGHHGRFNQRA
jgi:hypothetical protein